MTHAARLNLLLALTVVGFIVPNTFVVSYLIDEGFAVGDYIAAWFDSLPQTHLTLDIILAAVGFLIWTSWDGPRSGVRRWWLAIPAAFLVGICFALPGYLYFRERALGEGSSGSR